MRVSFIVTLLLNVIACTHSRSLADFLFGRSKCVSRGGGGCIKEIPYSSIGNVRGNRNSRIGGSRRSIGPHYWWQGSNNPFRIECLRGGGNCAPFVSRKLSHGGSNGYPSSPQRNLNAQQLLAVPMVMGVCPAKFICVHWQLCRNGVLITDGTGVIDKTNTKIPFTVSSTQKSCGSEMICCGIYPKILESNLANRQLQHVPQMQGFNFVQKDQNIPQHDLQIPGQADHPSEKENTQLAFSHKHPGFHEAIKFDTPRIPSSLENAQSEAINSTNNQKFGISGSSTKSQEIGNHKQEYKLGQGQVGTVVSIPSSSLESTFASSQIRKASDITDVPNKPSVSLISFGQPNPQFASRQPNNQNSPSSNLRTSFPFTQSGQHGISSVIDSKTPNVLFSADKSQETTQSEPELVLKQTHPIEKVPFDTLRAPVTFNEQSDKPSAGETPHTKQRGISSTFEVTSTTGTAKHKFILEEPSKIEEPPSDQSGVFFSRGHSVLPGSNGITNTIMPVISITSKNTNEKVKAELGNVSEGLHTIESVPNNSPGTSQFTVHPKQPDVSLISLHADSVKKPSDERNTYNNNDNNNNNKNNINNNNNNNTNNMSPTLHMKDNLQIEKEEKYNASKNNANEARHPNLSTNNFNSFSVEKHSPITTSLQSSEQPELHEFPHISVQRPVNIVDRHISKTAPAPTFSADQPNHPSIIENSHTQINFSPILDSQQQINNGRPDFTSEQIDITGTVPINPSGSKLELKNTEQPKSKQSDSLQSSGHHDNPDTLHFEKPVSTVEETHFKKTELTPSISFDIPKPPSHIGTTNTQTDYLQVPGYQHNIAQSKPDIKYEQLNNIEINDTNPAGKTHLLGESDQPESDLSSKFQSPLSTSSLYSLKQSVKDTAVHSIPILPTIERTEQQEKKEVTGFHKPGCDGSSNPFNTKTDTVSFASFIEDRQSNKNKFETLSLSDENKQPIAVVKTIPTQTGTSFTAGNQIKVDEPQPGYSSEQFIAPLPSDTAANENQEASHDKEFLETLSIDPSKQSDLQQTIIHDDGNTFLMDFVEQQKEGEYNSKVLDHHDTISKTKLETDFSASSGTKNVNLKEVEGLALVSPTKQKQPEFVGISHSQTHDLPLTGNKEAVKPIVPAISFVNIDENSNIQRNNQKPEVNKGKFEHTPVKPERVATVLSNAKIDGTLHIEETGINFSLNNFQNDQKPSSVVETTATQISDISDNPENVEYILDQGNNMQAVLPADNKKVETPHFEKQQEPDMQGQNNASGNQDYSDAVTSDFVKETNLRESPYPTSSFETLHVEKSGAPISSFESQLPTKINEGYSFAEPYTVKAIEADPSGTFQISKRPVSPQLPHTQTPVNPPSLDQVPDKTKDNFYDQPGVIGVISKISPETSKIAFGFVPPVNSGNIKKGIVHDASSTGLRLSELKGSSMTRGNIEQPLSIGISNSRTEETSLISNKSTKTDIVRPTHTPDQPAGIMTTSKTSATLFSRETPTSSVEVGQAHSPYGQLENKEPIQHYNIKQSNIHGNTVIDFSGVSPMSDKPEFPSSFGINQELGNLHSTDKLKTEEPEFITGQTDKVKTGFPNPSGESLFSGQSLPTPKSVIDETGHSFTSEFQVNDNHFELSGKPFIPQTQQPSGIKAEGDRSKSVGASSKLPFSSVLPSGVDEPTRLTTGISDPSPEYPFDQVSSFGGQDYRSSSVHRDQMGKQALLSSLVKTNPRVSTNNPMGMRMLGGNMMMGNMIMTTLMGTPLIGGSCSAATYCVAIEECNPYNGFIIMDRSQQAAVWPDSPTVPLLDCFVPAGGIQRGVCCQLPHPMVGLNGQFLD